MDADGSEPTKLTHDQSDDFGAVRFPDG